MNEIEQARFDKEMADMRARVEKAQQTAELASHSISTPSPVDNAPQIESVDNVTVAPGGTTVTFPRQFHSPPFVQATVIGSSALTVTVDSITETQCTFNVWDTTGTSVGGDINYQAIGE